jgi:hypothetical protein
MDIYAYKQELEEKLAAVNKVIADMVGSASKASKPGRKPPEGKKKGRKPMSPESKARMAAAAKKRWAEVKKAGKNRL